MSDIPQQDPSAADRPGLLASAQATLDERVHLALDQHAIVSVADASGTIVYVNDKFCQISGYAREELIGQNHRLVKSGEHGPAFYQALWDTISQGRVWRSEVCNRRKGGGLYWVEATITPVLDDSGLPCQYVSIHTDVTRIKVAEAAYRSQNALQEVLSAAAGRLLAAPADRLDAAIKYCLQLAGEHLAADRAYLYQLAPDGGAMLYTHEWCAPGVASHKQSLGSIAREDAERWWGQMRYGQWINIPDVAAMPPEASDLQSLLQGFGVKALCAFPMLRGEQMVGFIGFDQDTQTREWDQRAFGLLWMLADQIDSALLRRAAQRALEDSAARQNAILESTIDGILAVDARGQVLFCNQPFYRMWGVPEPLRQPGAAQDDMLLAHALKLLVDPAAFLHRAQALYQSNETADDLIELIDGRVFERHSKPLRVAGALSGRLWSFHDVTQRVQAEAAAAVAKERLRRGQLYANIGTWEWVVQTNELYWSERIAPLFGHPQGELETSYPNFLAAVHPEDRQAVIDAVNASVEYGLPYQIEHRVVWPDGSVRWLLERGGVDYDAYGKAQKMIGVVQDIDDRKRAEIALVAAREDAERANRAKSEFLARMSHELRTPLNAIMGFGQLMELDESLPEDQRDNVQEIMKAGRHLLELINEVLDLAKVEAGRIQLSLEQADLHEVVQDSLALVQPLAAQHGIALHCADLSGWCLHADRIRLKQVLLNLLSNAIKYNRAHGTVTLEARTAAPGMLRLTVRDTGVGIAPQRLQEVFEPFHRLDAEMQGVEGTGIGLTITRRLVELMHGQMGVDSELGVGSTFWVELPLSNGNTDSLASKPDQVDSIHVAKEAAGQSQSTGQPASTRTVLYIEDNPSNIKLMVQVMGQRPQVKLVVAQDGCKGIEQALACQPELVLLDIGLPKMDGFQVLELLQQLPALRHVPVVALSANAMPQDIERGLAAGFTDYLTKPLDVSRFLAVLDKLLGLAKDRS